MSAIGSPAALGDTHRTLTPESPHDGSGGRGYYGTSRGAGARCSRQLHHGPGVLLARGRAHGRGSLKYVAPVGVVWRSERRDVKTSLIIKVAVGLGLGVAPIIALSGMASAADPAVLSWGQSQGATYDAAYDAAAQQVAVEASASVSSMPTLPAGASGVSTGTGSSVSAAIAGLVIWSSERGNRFGVGEVDQNGLVTVAIVWARPTSAPVTAAAPTAAVTAPATSAAPVATPTTVAPTTVPPTTVPPTTVPPTTTAVSVPTTVPAATAALARHPNDVVIHAGAPTVSALDRSSSYSPRLDLEHGFLLGLGFGAILMVLLYLGLRARQRLVK